MVIGPTRCGKTTLINKINDYDGPLRRTPDIIYGKRTIDVPGAYIENTWMYKHIIAASQDACHILLLVDQTDNREVYSHGFAKLFNCPVTGVIAKSDLMLQNKEFCVNQLLKTGVDKPYFCISDKDDESIETLKKFILFNFKE